MTWSNKRYRELFIVSIVFVVVGLLWGIGGSLIAIPFAFMWLLTGQTLAGLERPIYFDVQFGFLAYGIGFAFLFGFISHSGSWRKVPGEAVIGALVIPMASLAIVHGGLTSGGILFELLGFPITVGASIGLGAGMILGVLIIVLSKASDPSGLGCGFTLVILLFGFVGFALTELVAQQSTFLRRVLVNLPINALALAAIIGFVWGFFETDKQRIRRTEK
jgi:hypothetical protein